MAKGLVAQDGRFYWTVDAHAGPGCPNKADDVQLVQFGCWCMGNNQKTLASPAKPSTAFSLSIPRFPGNRFLRFWN